VTEETRSRRRSTAIAIALSLVAAYAYFYEAGGWNQNSRFALVRAIIEHGVLYIDDTLRFDRERVTGDVAVRDGHFYSDKAPGLALVAVAPVRLAYPFVANPASREGIATLSYIATVVTAGIPGVIAALVVFWLAGVLGASRGAAAFSAWVFGLGSPAWCYATLFYGHSLATACLMVAFAAAVALRQSSTERRDWLLAAAVGVGGGWATVTEYPTAIPAALTSLLALVTVYQSGPARIRRVVVGVAGGALLCALVIVAFNVFSFGTPLALGYANVEGFTEMRKGFFGLTYPKRTILIWLLFGQYRGLLFLAPVLIAAPIGFLMLVRDPATRIPGVAAMSIAAYYLLFNASYIYWDGGWSYGPRHLAPALPFMSLALAPVWDRAKAPFRVALGALALFGAALAFIAVATTAQPPDTYRRPVTDLLWPNFAKGQLSINHQAFVEAGLRNERDPKAHAWNLGERLGLKGLMSLTPLLAIWSGIGVWWWTRREES
jgi:hypothetical protein